MFREQKKHTKKNHTKGFTYRMADGFLIGLKAKYYWRALSTARRVERKSCPQRGTGKTNVEHKTCVVIFGKNLAEHVALDENGKRCRKSKVF